MNERLLPPTGTPTSPIGFGCASLSAGSSRRHSVNLLSAAFDVGIRHFDVAPPYGMGTAEDVLGEAMRSRRAQITLATKVGITRPRYGSAIITARSFASPLRKLIPTLTRKIGASTYSGLTVKPRLDPTFVEASVVESLRRLRTDYLDLLLLHEVTPDTLTDEVLTFLDSLRRRGIVRALGTGTSYENTSAIRQSHPSFFDVWQYTWSIIDGSQEPVQKFSITHRAIQRGLGPLQRWMSEDASRSSWLSQATGVDLAEKDRLGMVLIGAAMNHNPQGITLVATRQMRRVTDYGSLINDAGIMNYGKRLLDALAGNSSFQELQYLSNASHQ